MEGNPERILRTILFRSRRFIRSAIRTTDGYGRQNHNLSVFSVVYFSGDFGNFQVISSYAERERIFLSDPCIRMSLREIIFLVSRNPTHLTQGDFWKGKKAWALSTGEALSTILAN